MKYFEALHTLLLEEKKADKAAMQLAAHSLSLSEKRNNGLLWYPVVIKATEPGYGDYLTIEVERTAQTEMSSQLRFGVVAALFSAGEKNNRLEGTVSYINGNILKLALKTDELPNWVRDGKLGIEAIFDEYSYTEMENALKNAATQAAGNELIQVLTGEKKPSFHTISPSTHNCKLNLEQLKAVEKIEAADQLAIVHGPPGTGKTTTLVCAIKNIATRTHRQILVLAPSNAAVDLLSEKLSDEGLNVVRIGNPARVLENQLRLTLDRKMAEHGRYKAIKKLKKQAAEYRQLAQKYKRNFGKEEREQRKALFTEARNVNKEVEKLEQYIFDDVLQKAQVITATLVGSNHYSIRQLQFDMVVIDEAAQALEPACWIPVLKAQKIVFAGDPCQLPPTIKSAIAAQQGLASTLMEKCMYLHPEAVVQLKEQFRMHESIMQYPSSVFYQTQLSAHGSVANHLVFEGDIPVVFIDTAGCGFEEQKENNTISNKEEADLLVQHLLGYISTLQLTTSAVIFPTVAVVAPYRGQVSLLSEKIQAIANTIPAKISVNTIDSFQGRESDVVYISLTRSNSESNIGFLSDLRRMNVAITRARKKLVVIGDSATLAQQEFYGNFIAFAEQHNGYQSAWEFITC